MPKKQISVVITDLDNTLFNWFQAWHVWFSRILEGLAKESGVDRHQLILEFKAIHQKRHTSEYSFAVRELPSLLAKHGSGDAIIDKYREILIRGARERSKALKLYRGVKKTLESLKRRGVLIVGYTESMEFYSKARLRKLKLDGIIDILYSPRDHDLPDTLSIEAIRRYPNEYYNLRFTKTKHTPHREKKPNPKVLLDIISGLNADVDDVLYVGDSLTKDVLMAQQAFVADVHAEYGVSHNNEKYELLRQVTHWTDEEVEKEREISNKQVVPNYVLRRDFSDILNLFDFKHFVEPIRSLDTEDKKMFLEIWKQIIDVQKHFNDLEFRTRGFAVTLVTAILGGAGFVYKSGYSEDLIILLLIVGLIATYLFFFMDYHWYHRLLYGAVNQGRFLEERLRKVLPEIGISNAIKDSSPNSMFFGLIRLDSRKRIRVFYVIIAGVFAALIILAIVTAPPLK